MNIKNASPYFPGILLFLIALLIGFLTYQDYGMAWDEPEQRHIGQLNYDYAVHGNPELLSFIRKEYGAGFEMPLIFLERQMHITDTRDIYLMRHLVTHIFFLVSVLFGYILIYRLFKNQFLACLGFLMLAMAPRIYAHSYFNTKDLPVLSLFIISFTLIQAAFEEKKATLFLLLGIVCGYTTGIRVMGIMLVALILFFLITDLITDLYNKEKPKKNIINILLFITGFCVTICASWPFLWKNPPGNFMIAYNIMSHYVWDAKVLLLGKFEFSQHLPRRYFPVWFLITNPVLWLITGFSGMAWIFFNGLRTPLHFLKNNIDRNFLIYFCCFVTPIIAVIWLRSVIYDDWRHLYFIYPSFVLMALYFIHKIYQTKYKLIIQTACIIQLGFLGFFMVSNHPVEHVYFNALVPHSKEYLRKNFDYEYWGVCYMKALEHIVHAQPNGTIKICYGPGGEPLTNNIMMLPERDRKRIEVLEECNGADYFITNFRWHPDDFPNPVEFSIVVQNSTAVCVYKTMH